MDPKDFHIVHHYEIETLSPLHIGSGDSLRRDFDYLEFGSGAGSDSHTIALIDHEKVLGIVGPSRIGEWVQHIQTGQSTLQWLRRYRRDLAAAHVSLREIEYREPENMPEFKSMITDAHGLPYLPASSLKGAIRTALLVAGLRKGGRVDRRIGQDEWKKTKVGKFFGQDMNIDLLRFVTPSDALFTKTRCLPVSLLNKTQQGWDFKRHRDPLFLEVVPKGQRTCTRIVYPKRLFEVMEMPTYAGHGIETARAIGHSALLRMVHEHSMRLLQRELDFWEKREHLPAAAGDYVQYLKGILDRAAKFDPAREALLRVGHGTGWTSITGGWQEFCMGYEDFDKLMEDRKRGDLPYPKTRKLAKGHIPFGYICLRHVEEDRRVFPKAQAVIADLLIEDQTSNVNVPTALDERRNSQGPTDLRRPLDGTQPLEPVGEAVSTDSPVKLRLRKGLELIAEYAPQPTDKVPFKTFKLLIGDPEEEQFVPLSYRTDLAPGRRCKVRITDLDPRSGRVRAIEFRGLCQE